MYLSVIKILFQWHV